MEQRILSKFNKAQIPVDKNKNPKENDKIRPSLFIIFFNKRLKMNPTKHPIKIEPKISYAKVKS